MLSLSARTSCCARWTVFTGALWVPGLLSFPDGDTNTLPGMLAARAVAATIPPVAAAATTSTAAVADSRSLRGMTVPLRVKAQRQMSIRVAGTVFGRYIGCQGDRAGVTARRSATSGGNVPPIAGSGTAASARGTRSEEHTSELQSPDHLVCRLLLEKKK